MSLDMNRLLVDVDNRAKCIGSLIEDLIEDLPHAAFLKDAKTGKYIKSNFMGTEFLGVESPSDVIGLTLNDVLNDFINRTDAEHEFFSDFAYWKDRQVETIRKIEYEAINSKCATSIKNTIFSYSGAIIVERTTKQPILSFDGQKTIAVLTHIYQDNTFKQGLYNLLHLYKQYYPEQKAIQQLLIHLDIDVYFNELPTHEEMKILLALHQDYDLSSETTDPSYQSLRAKVNTDVWQQMLIRLRAIHINAH